jgi:hypothetical protein
MPMWPVGLGLKYVGIWDMSMSGRHRIFTTFLIAGPAAFQKILMVMPKNNRSDD